MALSIITNDKIASPARSKIARSKDENDLAVPRGILVAIGISCCLWLGMLCVAAAFFLGY